MKRVVYCHCAYAKVVPPETKSEVLKKLCDSGKPFDGNRALLDLAGRLRERLKGVEIAHLKMTLDPGDPSGSLAVVSLVRSDAEPDLRESLVDPIGGGELVVNLRAEADPALLDVALRESLDARTRLEHVESFRPARPRPTHRLTEGSR